MKKSSIVIVCYVFGIIIGAIFLGLWDAETGPKALLGMLWTVIFLIALFYVEKKR